MAKSNSEASTGMPQLDFSTFPNQGFWLLITILCLFLMVRLLIIPRMDNILSNRRKVIEEDLVGAEKLREAAEELKNSITKEVDEAKLRATDILNRSKEKIKRSKELGMKEAAEITENLLSASEKKIETMREDAEKQIDGIALELYPKIVSKVFLKTD